MRSGKNVLLASVVAFSLPVSAQEPPSLFQISKDMSGLVVILDANFSGQTIEVSDDTGKFVKKTLWQWDQPFLQAFEFAAKEVEIHIPGPIESVRVRTIEGLEVYLQLTPYQNENGDTGVEVKSWYGAPTEEVKGIIYGLKDEGYEAVFSLDRMDPGAKALHFNTDSPYPGPFDPILKPTQPSTPEPN